MPLERDLVRWAWVETALGRWLVAASDGGVCFLALCSQEARAALEVWAGAQAPGAELREDPVALREPAGELAAYGDGRLRCFSTPLDLRGSPFERAVWRELLAIPFGQTRTYGELADRLGRPGAARAVGGAAGRNPVPVMVPCHRLLAAEGVGGFSAGLELKRSLLRLEASRGTSQLELDFGCGET